MVFSDTLNKLLETLQLIINVLDYNFHMTKR